MYILFPFSKDNEANNVQILFGGISSDNMTNQVKNASQHYLVRLSRWASISCTTVTELMWIEDLIDLSR